MSFLYTMRELLVVENMWTDTRCGGGGTIERWGYA